MVSHACKNFHFFVGFSLPLPTALPVGNAFLSFPGGFLPGISVCSLLAAATAQVLVSYTVNFKQTPGLVQNSPSCCCTWVSVCSWKFCPKRAVAEPSLERPGQDEGQLSLERFLDHSKIIPVIAGNARDKDFSYCFSFMETFSVGSLQIELEYPSCTELCVLRTFLLHELP